TCALPICRPPARPAGAGPPPLSLGLRSAQPDVAGFVPDLDFRAELRRVFPDPPEDAPRRLARGERRKTAVLRRALLVQVERVQAYLARDAAFPGDDGENALVPLPRQVREPRLVVVHVRRWLRVEP